MKRTTIAAFAIIGVLAACADEPDQHIGTQSCDSGVSAVAQAYMKGTESEPVRCGSQAIPATVPVTN